MEPNTASRLRERRKNKLRDFLSMCGPLGVSHLLIFGQTKVGTYGGGGNINLRIMRAPRGPTVTFRINKFALSADLARARRRPHSVGSEFQTPPLLVLNNFTSDQKHVKVLVTVFQNLFPAIQVHNMRLTTARRIVLLNYNAATDTIDWRHYLITLRPVGVSKSVRRAIEGTTSRSLVASSIATSSDSSSTRRPVSKKLVDLSSADDIAEFVLGRHRGLGARGQSPAASSAAYDSETEADTDMSDGEDDPSTPSSSRVELTMPYYGRSNRRIQTTGPTRASASHADEEGDESVRDPDEDEEAIGDNADSDSGPAQPVYSEQRAVRLREIGPRMELRCIKIEEGLGGASKKAVLQDLKASEG